MFFGLVDDLLTVYIIFLAWTWPREPRIGQNGDV
jgi:hypothetical protein